jgi:ubiquitin-conjugating enzyme E2 G1
LPARNKRCNAVYPDGKVCISILHTPGTDRFNEMESAEERWRPILSVEAVLLSVLSLLSDPNDSSPANIDAAKQWRDDRKGFNRKARRTAARTLEG